MTKKIYTVSKAVDMMVKEIVPECQTEWRKILKSCLNCMRVDDQYIDPKFHWIKVDDNKVMAM